MNNPFSQPQNAHNPFAPEDSFENSDGTVADMTLAITDSAAERLKAVFADKTDATPMLRLTVTGGGCSGFQYKFDFDNATRDNDMTFTHKGATVVSDKQSMTLLTGSTLDYVEDMMGSNFRIDNPAATISCGCGSSFNI